MRPEAIWWGQIGNSLRLITAVTEHLRDCRPAVLQVPARLPWRQEFYESVDLRRSALGTGRGLKRLEWEAGADPGEFVLEELCTTRVRAEYWPGQTVAAYLGNREDLDLNEYDVWITGIHSREDLAKWASFAAEYDRTSAGLSERAAFLVEYDGTPMGTPGLDRIACSVESYDCRVFCLEAAAALNNTPLREYQAELALSIGNRDPELCWALLGMGEELLLDPVWNVQQRIRQWRDSSGAQYPELGEQQIVSAAWRAAVVLFFPIVEQWRMDFVANHAAALSRYLPISDSYGNVIKDPEDLEIGTLNRIVHLPGSPFSPEEARAVRLCRKVRNQLAHNQVLSCEDALSIVQL